MTGDLSNFHVVMQSVGYRTWDVAGTNLPTIAFEDEATMGFVCGFATPRAIIDGWREAEAGLLNRFAQHFRVAGDKAWNVYAVFVTTARASDEERREVRWIEEDLERTRKITATGLITREDVVTALLPLLPIVAKPVLAPEDATQRLMRRIAVIAPQVSDLALDNAVDPADVAERLRGAR